MKEESVPTFRSWFAANSDAIDALVFDVDGVLIKGKSLPGTVELLADIRERGLPFLLLTNDSSQPPERKCARLAAAGLTVGVDELVSCGHALAEWVAANRLEGASARLLGTLGNPCYAEQAGLTVHRGATDSGDVRVLIIGEDDFDWHTELEEAFNLLLRNPQLPVVVPNPDDCYPGHNGHLHIGSGALGRFLQTLCHARGVELELHFLGKPCEPAFLCAHHRLEQHCGHPVRRDRVMILGDSLSSDIRGGQAFGYKTGLLMTGITRPAQFRCGNPEPDFIFRTL